MNKLLLGMLATGAAVAAGYVISKVLNSSDDDFDDYDDYDDYDDIYDDDEVIDFDINDSSEENAEKAEEKADSQEDADKTEEDLDSDEIEIE